MLPSQIRTDSGGATEEILNSITHAVGAGLSIACLIVLLLLSGRDPSVWKYVGFSIFSVSQILTFLASALTHGFSARPPIRRKLSFLDFSSIYILIAGTYTPVCLIALRGNWGWTVFGIMWGLAAVGIVLRIVFFNRLRLIANLMFLVMGWLVLIVLRPLILATSMRFVIWILSAGAWFTLGFIFFMWRKLPFSHIIWHLAVIGGSMTFTVAFAIHLA